MSSMQTKDVMEKLRAHPLFRKVIAGVSEKDREYIEKTVVAFVDQLTDGLGTVSSNPQARDRLRDIANGKTPTSGSVG